ncbi:MAG: response regulator [Acidobacteria bacterium]|nr:response regulator [Acidobacteriota bacterium]
MDILRGAGAPAGGITRALRLLTVAVVVVPVILFTIAAWINYGAAFRDARERVDRARDAIHEYALKAFEGDELILDRIAEHVAGKDRSELIGSEDFHRYLQQFDGKPQISAVGLIIPARGLAASNLIFPVPNIEVGPPNYIRVDRDGKEPIYIGRAVSGTFTQAPQFSVVRLDRAFGEDPGPGLIFVSTRLSDFVGYYRTIVDLKDFLITVIRSDGAVLARSPGDNLVGAALSTKSHFRQAIAREPKSGSYDGASELDGIERLFSYRQLRDYPVYVSVALKRSAVVQGWAWLMADHLAIGLPAWISLLLLASLALRRSRAADAAVAAVQVHSERREVAEASLRHIQKMDVVGQLTGGIAHDFNNLLAVITGNLELILRKPQEVVRVGRVAKAALQAAERGERLIEQLLMFSRRQMMRPTTLNLNSVLLDFETLLRHAASHSIELRLKLDPALELSNVDRSQFEAAVLNLVVNARDALLKGGRITITTANAVIDGRAAEEDSEIAPGPYVMVSVRDNGTGIAPSVLPHVYEPFFTTKEVGKGSGLGLSQVFGFVTESAGHVRIDSKLGRGTTVRLYLPRCTDVLNESQPAARIPQPSGGGTVLVVDDDESVLETAKETVADLGYHVLSAHNGREALQILKGSDHVDLLFSDIVMPGGINGIQLADEARRLQPSLKVLRTSGYTTASLMDKHGLPAEFPVLGKPYRREQLAANFYHILHSHTAPSLLN